MGTNKKSKGSDLRDKSIEDLKRYIEDLSAELFNLRFQHATGQLDNPHKLALTRREIARLLTLRQEREVGQTGGGGA